jgi:rhodanese-related sulfurtransferase
MRIPFPWWLPVGRVPEITTQELRSLLKQDRSLQVVDARTELEFRQGTIGQARHAPLTGMPGSLARLDLDASRPVVVLCLSGHRSRPGTRWLRARGMEAYSLKGGVLAWKQAGFPMEHPILV